MGLFQVENMFCVGSPLAVFLIMRGSTTFVRETANLKRIYNIFHPYDPVVQLSILYDRILTK